MKFNFFAFRHFYYFSIFPTPNSTNSLSKSEIKVFSLYRIYLSFSLLEANLMKINFNIYSNLEALTRLLESKHLFIKKLKLSTAILENNKYFSSSPALIN